MKQSEFIEMLQAAGNGNLRQGVFYPGDEDRVRKFKGAANGVNVKGLEQREWPFEHVAEAWSTNTGGNVYHDYLLMDDGQLIVINDVGVVVLRCREDYEDYVDNWDEWINTERMTAASRILSDPPSPHFRVAYEVVRDIPRSVFDDEVHEEIWVRQGLRERLSRIGLSCESNPHDGTTVFDEFGRRGLLRFYVIVPYSPEVALTYEKAESAASRAIVLPLDWANSTSMVGSQRVGS